MHKSVFITNLVASKKAAGMSQVGLASLSGVSNSYLSDLIKGKANPSLKVMESLAKALKIPLWRLLLPSETYYSLCPVLANGEKVAGSTRVLVTLNPHHLYVVNQWFSTAKSQDKDN